MVDDAADTVNTPPAAVPAGINGHDQVRTPAGPSYLGSVGTVHHGWRNSLVIGVIIALGFANFIGILAGNHYSAKAAAQHTNAEIIMQTKQQGAQILALTAEVHARQATGQQTQALIQSELDILKDATTPGGRIYEEGQANQAHVISLVVTCLQSIVEHPTAPLPAACTSP